MSVKHDKPGGKPGDNPVAPGGFAEIEQAHREKMNAVAHLLGDVFKGYGFCLLVFDTSDPDAGNGVDDNAGRVNCIANVERADMLVGLKEFIAANEGRVMAAPGSVQ